MTLGLAGTQTSSSQDSYTPQAVLDRLKEGNERFTTGALLERAWSDQVRATADGQYPLAAVLGCIDSRVPVERVFDQGIGDIVTVRVAGNVVNEDVLGSLEFACKVAGSKIVLVLGHTSCGAVEGAISEVHFGNLTGLLRKIEPAVEAAKREASPDDPGFADHVARTNVGLAIESIRSSSPVLAGMEIDGEIAIVGAMYDVSGGAVQFS
jgi:carbonic anhydrase